MRGTIAFQLTALYRDFLAFTTDELKVLGLSYGQMPMILFTGKHPGCTQADLTRALKLDWGYSQRCIAKLADAGFLQKQYNGEKSCNCLTLTEKGAQAFETCHSVFHTWDQERASGLTEEEKKTLTLLLNKITEEVTKG